MELNEKIEFRKIRDFGGILNVTFEFIRQNYKKLSLSLLYITGPAILLANILPLILFRRVLGFNLQYDTLEENLGTIIGSITLYIFMMFIVFQLLFTVTYSYIDLYLDKNLNEFDVSDVWDRTKKYFWLFCTTSIGTFFVIMIAFILLVIPGIYISVVLSLIYMVRMREKLSFFDSISRCRVLITDHWWFTFGLVLVLSIIESLFSTILSFPQMIVTGIRTLHFIKTQGESYNNNDIITIITTIIASFGYLFYAIIIIGISFYYYSLVEKKEATGLFEKLDSINTQN